MTSVLSLVGELVLQSGAAARDTIVTRADRGVLEQITAVVSTLTTFAVFALIVVSIPVAWRLRTTYLKFDRFLETMHNDIAPVVAHARDISDNVNFITTSVRADVAKLRDTIDAGNERLRRALDSSEERVKEFNALLTVVQQEAEGLFVSTASTVRGVQQGTRVFQDRGGMDLASDELDGADAPRDLDIQEETDGYDSRTESPADAGPAAPRVRPRSRRRRA